METQSKMDRSPPDNGAVAMAFWGDEIEEFGDQIARMSAGKAGELREYVVFQVGALRGERRPQGTLRDFA